MPEGNPLAEQLKAAGAPAALIEQAQERGADSGEVIEVLRCNLPAVRIFERCQLTYIAGVSGAVCLGVSALEIQAALQLQGVPPHRWRRISDGVQLMARTAAELINRKP